MNLRGKITKPGYLKIYLKIMGLVYVVFSIPVILQNYLVYRNISGFRIEFLIIPLIVATIFGFLLSKNKILKMRLIKSNQAKSEFLSRVSHELRTPLNSILGFGQILLIDPGSLNEVQKSQLSRILDSGKHLLKIVNELLELSTIEAGKLQINFSEVPIDKCIKDAVEFLEPLALKHNIKITNDTIECRSVKINADPSRLLEILLNIGSNAIKFNEPGGSVTIQCKKIVSDQVTISFKDTGPGIPENKLEEIFDPFSRISQDNGTIEGTGLGLPITKNLVYLMNGEIGCRNNTPEKGCEFWLTFKSL